MTDYIAPKAKHAAAKTTPGRPSSVVSKLKAGITDAIARHHERTVSLRVHAATRQDGLVTEVTPAEPERASGFSWKSPFRRVANWFGAVYVAHEARILALRVYDRKRG